MEGPPHGRPFVVSVRALAISRRSREFVPGLAVDDHLDVLAGRVRSLDLEIAVPHAVVDVVDDGDPVHHGDCRRALLVERTHHGASGMGSIGTSMASSGSIGGSTITIWASAAPGDERERRQRALDEEYDMRISWVEWIGAEPQGRPAHYSSRQMMVPVWPLRGDFRPRGRPPRNRAPASPRAWCAAARRRTVRSIRARAGNRAAPGERSRPLIAAIASRGDAFAEPAGPSAASRRRLPPASAPRR